MTKCLVYNSRNRAIHSAPKESSGLQLVCDRHFIAWASPASPASVLIVTLAIGLLGPRTTNLALETISQ
jgi:hypothetical protein